MVDVFGREFAWFIQFGFGTAERFSILATAQLNLDIAI